MSPLPWESPLQHALILALAVGVDLWRGEPPARIHPVVWMGRLIGFIRDAAPDAPWARLLWGMAMAILLPTLCAAAASPAPKVTTRLAASSTAKGKAKAVCTPSPRN